MSCNLLYLVKGNSKSQLKVDIIREDTGEREDLTDCTVTCYFRKTRSTAIEFTIIGVGTAEQLTNGEVIFPFVSKLDDIDSGYYNIEVGVLYPDTLEEKIYEYLQCHIRD